MTYWIAIGYDKRQFIVTANDMNEALVTVSQLPKWRGGMVHELTDRFGQVINRFSVKRNG